MNVLDSNIWREAFVYDVKRDSKGAIRAYFIRFLGWSKKWDRVVFSKLLEDEMKGDSKGGIPELGVDGFRPWGTEVYEWRRKIGIGSVVEVSGKNVVCVRACVCVCACGCENQTPKPSSLKTPIILPPSRACSLLLTASHAGKI